MNRRWRFDGFLVAMVFVLLFHHNLSFCWSLNSEGLYQYSCMVRTVVYWVLLKWVFVLDAGLALLRFRERVIRDPYGVLGNWNSGGGEDDDDDPCSWFGVECSDGKVISL